MICIINSPRHRHAGATLCAVARRHACPLYACDVAQALGMPPHKFVAVVANVLAILDLKRLAATPELAVEHELVLRNAFLRKGIQELVPDPHMQVPRPRSLCTLVLLNSCLRGGSRRCSGSSAMLMCLAMKHVLLLHMQ